MDKAQLWDNLVNDIRHGGWIIIPREFGPEEALLKNIAPYEPIKPFLKDTTHDPSRGA